MLSMRNATLNDLPAITDIYNEAILTTDATFDTQTKTVDEQEGWFVKHGGKFPIMVADLDGRVIGWASLSQWSDRCAYADTAEISIYIKSEFQGQGTGKKLMKAIVTAGEKTGLHTVIARITEGNAVSVHLHQEVGFDDIGIMREVGRKEGRLLDVRIMQKVYRPQ